MKQKVRVVGIIKKDDSFLLLKKVLHDDSDAVMWCLPAGKINFGEQPEEAMGRTIFETLNQKIETIKIRDVITFTNQSDGSNIYNLYIIYDITLAENSDLKLELSDKYSAYKYVNFSTDVNSNFRLADDTAPVISVEFGHKKIGKVNRIDARAAVLGATIYTDGGSRGNPGPSAIGYVIIDENGKEVERGGEFIGYATSRLAEYYGLKAGIEKAFQYGFKTVKFVSDNLMMVNQMNGIYTVKNSDILPVYEEILKLIQRFDAVAFTHVRREQDQAADAELNEVLDEYTIERA